LPIWLPIAVVILILARIVSWNAPVKNDADLVHWMDIDQAVAASARSHRPILYEFSAEWCGPCHLLEREVFMDAGLAAKINGHYIAVKVIDRQREDGRNAGNVQQLMDRYSVNAFPTVVIAAQDGSVRGRTVGYPGRDQFAAFLDGAR